MAFMAFIPVVPTLVSLVLALPLPLGLGGIAMFIVSIVISIVSLGIALGIPTRRVFVALPLASLVSIGAFVLGFPALPIVIVSPILFPTRIIGPAFTLASPSKTTPGVISLVPIFVFSDFSHIILGICGSASPRSWRFGLWWFFQHFEVHVMQPLSIIIGAWFITFSLSFSSPFFLLLLFFSSFLIVCATVIMVEVVAVLGDSSTSFIGEVRFCVCIFLAIFKVFAVFAFLSSNPLSNFILFILFILFVLVLLVLLILLILRILLDLLILCVFL
mmetsp:Transcript_66453/g.134906  ORF Transcript_66453/g.134906 Transcript_66453/m.134906 type:complete len:274 (-) Transcript_66453:347-1168(-)